MSDGALLKSKVKNQKSKIFIITHNDVSRIDLLKRLREMNNKRTDYLFQFNDFHILCSSKYQDADRREFDKLQDLIGLEE